MLRRERTKYVAPAARELRPNIAAIVLAGPVAAITFGVSVTGFSGVSGVSGVTVVSQTTYAWNCTNRFCSVETPTPFETATVPPTIPSARVLSFALLASSSSVEPAT